MFQIISHSIELLTLISFSEFEFSTVNYLDLPPFFTWWQKVQNFACILYNMHVKFVKEFGNNKKYLSQFIFRSLFLT